MTTQIIHTNKKAKKAKTPNTDLVLKKEKTIESLESVEITVADDLTFSWENYQFIPQNSTELFRSSFNTFIGDLANNKNFDILKLSNALFVEMQIDPIKAPTTVLHYITDYIANPQTHLYISPTQFQFLLRKAYSLAIPLFLLFKLRLFFKQIDSHGSQFGAFHAEFNTILMKFASRSLGINVFRNYDYTLTMVPKEQDSLAQHVTRVESTFKSIQGQLFKGLSLCDSLIGKSILAQFTVKVPRSFSLVNFAALFCTNVSTLITLNKLLVSDYDVLNKFILAFLPSPNLPDSFLSDNKDQRKSLLRLLGNFCINFRLLYYYGLWEDNAILSSTWSNIFKSKRTFSVSLSEKEFHSFFEMKTLSRNLFSSIVSLITESTFGLSSFLALHMNPKVWAFNVSNASLDKHAQLDDSLTALLFAKNDALANTFNSVKKSKEELKNSKLFIDITTLSPTIDKSPVEAVVIDKESK